MLKLKVKKLCGTARLPVRATPGSACYDVFSVVELLLTPRRRTTIPTGLAFELPVEVGLEIRPRSGLALRGMIILNSPGTLDSDYRGQLLVICTNISDTSILINKGDRIAQIRLFRVIDLEFEEVGELTPTNRGIGGFGSTGR